MMKAGFVILFLLFQFNFVQAVEENQIPLNIDQQNKAVDVGHQSSNKLFLSGVIVIALIGSAYFLVRKYKMSNSINKSNRQIKVLSQHYLGPKKSLAIIRVAGESILIGVTDSHISMIKSLSLIDDEVPSEVPQKFSEVMSSDDVSKVPTTEKVSFDKLVPEELEEEFSFAGIKDSVSKKIRSMRSLS